MELISSRAELTENLTLVGEYLTAPGVERDFASDIIGRGICFVVTDVNSKLLFAPSRFVGYRANTRHDHIHNASKDGRDTNAALEDLLGSPPLPDKNLEHEYEAFCGSVGAPVHAAPFGTERKFWDLRGRLLSRAG